MTSAIICTACGSKIAATRQICPKCRAAIVRIDAAAGAARSRRLAAAAAILSGTCVLGLGLLWATADRPLSESTSAAPADPLAARRPVVVQAAPEPVSPTHESQRRYMASSDHAAVSYGSGDYASALTHLQAAVEKNPQDAESASNLGQVLVKLDRTAEAIPFFQRACTLDPDRWTYRFNLARGLALLQQWDESIDAYRKAKQLFPGDYVTTFNLAMTLHKKGDDAAAVDEYKDAIKLNPEESSFRMALAISYEALQQPQDAAAAYGEYLKLAPSAADADRVRARIAQLTAQPVSSKGVTAGL